MRTKQPAIVISAKRKRRRIRYETTTAADKVGLNAGIASAKDDFDRKIDQARAECYQEKYVPGDRYKVAKKASKENYWRAKVEAAKLYDRTLDQAKKEYTRQIAEVEENYDEIKKTARERYEMTLDDANRRRDAVAAGSIGWNDRIQESIDEA